MFTQMVFVCLFGLWSGGEGTAGLVGTVAELGAKGVRTKPSLDAEAVRSALILLQRENDTVRTGEAEASSGAPLGVIGTVEQVYVEDIPVAFPARIDTGASLCSLGVEEVKYFERDGRPWVSFSIKPRDDGQVYTFERRVRRMVKIKQHDERDALKRPLVRMKVRMGGMTLRREFTLADRSNFKYQVLVGRNLLKGVALVDASNANLLD